jgi:hypothetical protein
MKTGPCRGQFNRWFFDPVAKECREFVYGGCHGNENRFATRESCEQRCKQNPAESECNQSINQSIKQPINQTILLSVCQLASDRGPCDADFTMWYFDTESGSCQQFVYGGCHGNANRFKSATECDAMCRPPASKSVGA